MLLFALVYLCTGCLWGFLLAWLAVREAAWTRTEGPYVALFCAACALLWPFMLAATAWQWWQTMRERKVTHDQ